nr:hypothetical protein [Polynucleobacter sp.]
MHFLTDADTAVVRTVDLRYAPLLFAHVVLPAAIRKSVRIDPKYDSYLQIRSPYRQCMQMTRDISDKVDHCGPIRLQTQPPDPSYGIRGR